MRRKNLVIFLALVLAIKLHLLYGKCQVMKNQLVVKNFGSTFLSDVKNKYRWEQNKDPEKISRKVDVAVSN
jgi:hypothetical protein